MDASRATWADRLALPILAAIFATGWYLVGAGRDTPIIDDWVYAWSVEHFLKTGALRVLGYSGFYPLAQILWGAPFAKILGFSFAALRASTVCLSILGCWAWYLTLVELGCDLRSRVLATLVLVLNPVYFALSFSFMTDVPFLSLTNLAVYFVVSAARRQRPLRMWIAATFAIAAFLVRPLGAAIPVAALTAVPWRRGLRDVARGWLTPLAAAAGAMAVLWLVTNRLMGPAEWQTTRLDNLKYWTTISLRTYARWNAHVVSEAVFPLAPVLLAALVARRGTLAVALTLAVAAGPAIVLQGHVIPSPLPNWQTWSLQDIGARAMISGTAAPSAWSGYVMPWLRGVSVLLLATLAVAAVRWLFVKREREPGSVALMALALLLFGMINALWLYNDRYYIVFVPALAFLSTRVGSLRVSVAAPLLALWAVVAVTGTRDMLGVNDTAGQIAQRLEGSGVHAWEIDAGYPWDGWRLYAHPDNLAPGGDANTDVPFVTSDALTLYTIASAPQEGYDILDVVPLKDATWQATRQLYVLKKRP